MILTTTLVCLLLCATRAGASPGATFTVNSTNDAVDANPGDGVCATAAGGCTLRAAIQETNALSSADTITLPAGTYILTIAGKGEYAAATGDLNVNDDVTINGAGAASTTIDGGHLDRVFDIGTVAATASAAISQLTVQNGQNCVGGGIVNAGSLTLSDVAVVSNLSCSDGGGIFNAGTLHFSRGTISGNVVGEIGGALENEGTASLANVTVSGNTIWPTPSSGAIVNRDGAVLNLNNVTIFDNPDMVGLATDEALPGVSPGGQTELANTIVAGKGSGSDCLGPLISLGYNLIREASGCTISGDPTGNIIGLDPKLGPLQDNGGPTLTHALLTGSPAIDAGNPASPGSGGSACEATDQRGIPRPQGPRCDMGAYEAAGPVGGIAELPDIAGSSGGEAAVAAGGSGWSASHHAALVGGLLVVVALTAGAWYARRRWLRQRS